MQGLGDTRFRGPAGRGADQRSAFQAVPALLLRERYALSPRFAQRAGPHWENWPEAGVPSRPPRFCSVGDAFHQSASATDIGPSLSTGGSRAPRG